MPEDLFDWHKLVRRTDPPTSEDAAKKAKPSQGHWDCVFIMKHCKSLHGDWIAREVDALAPSMGITTRGLWRRCGKEMIELGLIRYVYEEHDGELKVKRRDGQQCFVLVEGETHD